MSRGEETDEPTTADDHAVSGEPVDLSKAESAEEPSGPAPRYAVVISGDGSAAIDGEPVPLADGETVDAAILDRLHGYARDRNTTVTATISDPAAGYVAFVEVAPDGSSSLLEQEGQLPEPAQELGPVRPPLGDVEPAVQAVHPEPYEPMVGAGPSGDDDDLDDPDHPDDRADDRDDDLDDDLEDNLEHGDDDGDGNRDDGDDPFDVEAYTLEQERERRLAGPPPPPPPPSPAVRPVSKVAPGNGRRQSDDEYASPGLLHKPLVVGPVALAVAALVIVPLVILGSGAPDDGGRQKQTARSGAETSGTPLAEETAPTDSASASTLLPPPSATASSSAKPKTSKGAKAPKSGGGTGGLAGVTVTVTAKPPRATVTAKPAQDTAATAVNRLHRSDPSGRHICYRAYLSGQGWQKPVCDGTLAGTTSGTHPIQALNIAEYGGAGSAANAFVHNPASTNGQGKWEPQWTAVMGDGKNNYIGSTKSGAPYMTGFAINIGSGQVCRSAIVHGYDWGSADCAQPRPGYIFGGTLENTRWLEAVKLWM
ncbi:hypothetical protein AB0M61_23810 [Streptomyces sp. NPDC051642]|uniref:hypothetical protein n=1 Tax=Streptomyces sp. NPDC051642 TaxID=3154646 RepID=UPI0034427F27